MPAIKSSDGVEIHYKICGHGTLNLIFLHGWGGAAETWEDVVVGLDPALFRAICPDLRGHGRSGSRSRNYSWKIFARDILAIAEREQARQFVSVGFSMGGKLSCFLAAKYPDRISAQVLVAPVAPGTVPIDRQLGLQICREAKDWRRGKELFKSWFGPATPEGTMDTCCQTIAGTQQFVLETTAEMILWTSLAREIGKLNMPSLVVTGDSDPTYGIAYQREQMFPFLNRFKVATVASGHFIPHERPMELGHLISEFASEIQ